MEKKLLHLKVGDKVIFRYLAIQYLSWGKFSFGHLGRVLRGCRGAEGVEGEGRGDRGD